MIISKNIALLMFGKGAERRNTANYFTPYKLQESAGESSDNGSKGSSGAVI